MNTAITPNYYIRNAHNMDFQNIRRLLSLRTSKFIGPSKRKIFDPDFFFDVYSTHNMIVTFKKGDENLIGYAEIKHYPKIPALPKECWMYWLKHHYCINLPITLSNVLFLNYLIYDTKYCPGLMLQVLREIFYRERSVRYIISVELPRRNYTFKEDEPDFSIFEKFSTVYYPKEFSVGSCKNTQKVHIIFRDAIISKMRFRKALTEDNDEIVDIIDQDRPMFKEELGDYYIAEEILTEAPHKTFIVVEVNHQSVGFIWLNININTIKLIKNFELETYDNLLKFDPTEYWKVMSHDYHDIDRRPKENLLTLKAINTLYNQLRKGSGPFPLKSETSSVSIFSHFSLPVVVDSDSSSSAEVEEETDFTLRDPIFQKFKVLDEYLKSKNWYIRRVERNFRLRYNSYAYGKSTESLHSNAFTLQLFGLHQALDCRKIYQFLVAAFSAQPDRDYCIFSVPRAWPTSKSIRELLRYFARVMPRADSRISESVYITHRSAIMGDIIINYVRSEDVDQLKAILFHSTKHKTNSTSEKYQGADKFKQSSSSYRFGTGSKTEIKSEPSFISPRQLHIAATSRQDLTNMPSKTSRQALSARDLRHSNTASNTRLHAKSSSANLLPSLSKHSTIPVPKTNIKAESVKELPKTPIEMEAEILDQILNEVYTNEYSDYKVLKISVGDSTRPEYSEIIGFIVMRKFEQLHLLHKNYIIPECDTSRIFCQCEIIMLKLHPLFRFDSDFIFREIARITDYWNYFYFQPIGGNMHPLSNDLITRMQPVEPRREKKKFFSEADFVPFFTKETIPALRSLHLTQDYYAIYQQNMRPTKYFGLKETIVIIGYNTFTKAFLRHYIFYFNYKRFSSHHNTNMHLCVPGLDITVIAPPGIVEADQECSFKCEFCKNQSECYINKLNHNSYVRDVSYRMDVSKYVKFINGNIESIEREKQKILMDDNCAIYYDRLIIFTSLLFGPPRHISSTEKLPPNYQHINNRFDKIVTYHKLQALMGALQFILPKIIVYGSHLHAFEFINFLLHHGVKAESISLVMPQFTYVDSEIHLNNPYCDSAIEVILQEMVEDLKVTVYENVKLTHWTTYPTDVDIESISFYHYDSNECRNVLVTLKCDFFVSFLETKTYTAMEQVLQDAGIEMNGELMLIDRYYRTNDPRILAHGRNTEFKVELNHQTRYANPREVAEKFLEIIGLPFDQQDLTIDEKFRQPSLCKLDLPFNYKIVKIISPKLYLENHLTNEYSNSLTTYKDNDFCRIRLNEHGFIEEIVVVTQKKLSLEFLEFFCGKHEKLLNNLFTNWRMGKVENFLEFFQQPWTELIMHDHFNELRENNRELIIETIKDILTYKKGQDRQSRRLLTYRRLADMSMPAEFEEQLFNFLRKYRKDFHFKFALPEDFQQ